MKSCETFLLLLSLSSSLLFTVCFVCHSIYSIVCLLVFLANTQSLLWKHFRRYLIIRLNDFLLLIAFVDINKAFNSNEGRHWSRFSSYHRTFPVSGADPGGIRPRPPIPFCHGLWPPPSSEEKLFLSLNFSNFCDYFVQKVVSEVIKCCQLQGTSPPDHYMLAQTWSHPWLVV